MDKKLELEYHSSFENQRDSMIRYARLTGLDKHHSFLKKLGYGFLVFNVFLLLLVLFSSKPTSSSGYFFNGFGFLISLWLIFYRRLWIRGIEYTLKKTGSEPESGKLYITEEGMSSVTKIFTINFSWMNLKEIIFEPGLVCFYFEKIGLFTFRQQYFSDLTAMKEFMLQVKEFLPEEKKPLFTEEKTVSEK